MSESAMESRIKSIADGTFATIQLYSGSGESLQLNCIFKEDIAPSFTVVVPPGRFPKVIDMARPCLLTILLEEERPLVFTAKICEITSDRSLNLIAFEEIDPTSLRDYFRVSLALPVTISSIEDDGSPAKANWSLTGETLDLSGSGSLAVFTSECRARTKIFIEIDLDSPPKHVFCHGHVVRTKRMRGGRWQTALHFDDIGQQVRDAIITNCLHEQRRRLRDYVKIA